MNHFQITLREYKDDNFVGHVQIDTDIKYISDKFDISLYNLGNCFCIKEEAETMAKKIKKLLKENHEKTKENS